MKKVIHLLLMLFVFQSVAYAAYSWEFKSAKFQVARTESLTYQDNQLTKFTTEPHRGTVFNTYLNLCTTYIL